MKNKLIFAKAGVASVAMTILITALLLACGGSQVAVDDGASKVAEQAYALMTQVAWDDYANLVHPDALDEFKSLVMDPIEASLANQPDSLRPDSIAIVRQAFEMASLAELPSLEFFQTVMRAIFNGVPQLRSTFVTLKTEVIGQVAEGDNTVHVVSRAYMIINSVNVGEMTVLSLVKVDDEWKVLLSTRTRGLAQFVLQGFRPVGP